MNRQYDGLKSSMQSYCISRVLSRRRYITLFSIKPSEGPMDLIACDICGTEGVLEVSEPQRDDPFYARVVRCSKCNGVGWVPAPKPVKVQISVSDEPF